MFAPDVLAAGVAPPAPVGGPRPTVFPIHTRSKAALVAEYLRLFQMVTHHGTYVDGFAGPQAPDDLESWAARLVLDLQPLRLRNFYLYDMNADKFDALEHLRVEHSDKNVRTRHGDFNVLLDDLLSSGVIPEEEATFCLLDQRTFECHWSTVERLARHKSGFKIELFYFFGHSWLDRAVRGTTVNFAMIDSWWGGAGWLQFMEPDPVDRPLRFAERFRTELNYRFVGAYPIYNAEEGGRKLYYMLHASDHSAAPEFMERAYQAVVRQGRPDSQIGLPLG
jgi:three-Cys-motif partner protein